MKQKIIRSFRTEMLAAGLYGRLARQYSKSLPNLADRLRKAAEDERMHGRLFRQCHINMYKENICGEIIWTIAGKAAACLLIPVPLEKKLKSLSGKEYRAVAMIGRELENGEDSPYLKVLKRILPDEKSHAAIYEELFSVHGTGRT